jgi:hypothetical protein
MKRIIGGDAEALQGAGAEAAAAPEARGGRCGS